VFNFLKPKKKYNPKQSLSFLSADIHNHMLPGVDDGAQNIDEALEMAQAYHALGIQKIWLSPHINESFPNTTAELQERYQALRHTLAREYPRMEIYLGAEYKVDALFKERLAQKDLLTIGERHVLIELPFLHPPMGWEEQLFQLQMAGYTPILAHTERYAYMMDQWETLIELPGRGIELQLNLLSLSGHYGQPARQLALKLLKHQAYKWVATDAHTARHLHKIESHILPKWPQQLTNEQYQRNQDL
jgi:tyrosine-protein phosphatase YwqE